jgi:hypothetical protein
VAQFADRKIFHMALYGDIGNRAAAGLKRACSFFEQRAASAFFAVGFFVRRRRFSLKRI